MNNNKILLIMFGIIVLLAGVILFINKTSNNAKLLDHIDISLEDQNCRTGKDCIIISTKCNACECGIPINKINELKYKEKFNEVCKNYHGRVCDYCCPTPNARCVNNRCILSNLTSEGVEFNSCG